MPVRQAGDPIPKELIREMRQRHGLSQDELARRLGLKGGKSVISGWENGHSACEGPVAELLLLLFGAGNAPIALVILNDEMDRQWQRARNSLTSWRQVSASPIDGGSISKQKFSALFPGVEIPAVEHVHGFPFIDRGLPKGVYGLSERWVGAIPIEKNRPPGYLWMLDRTAAFAYREQIWEDQPTSVTGGNTHIGSILHVALSLTWFLSRLIKSAYDDADFELHLQLDLEGMENRGVVAYRSDRPFPDLSLDEPALLAVDNRITGTLIKTARLIAENPYQVGLELTAEVMRKLNKSLASQIALDLQVKRRHVEDIQLGSIRFLGFLDGTLHRQPRRGTVSMNGQLVGTIEQSPRGFAFTYDPGYLKSPRAVPLSPTLPLDTASYETPGLHPFFSNLLPEGSRLDQVARSRKLDKGDRFGILLALGDETIGAVEVRPTHADGA
jgi:serine/threonine-protein kinase HipA